MTTYTTFDSPVGCLTIASDGTAVTGIFMRVPNGFNLGAQDDATQVLSEARTQLQQYFSGERRDFDLALDPFGTPFQIRVWNELLKIPFGDTISYGELARRMGDPNASRAVGLANGRNPISIVIPCHRVIGASGALTGYGGGLDNKKTLLEHERDVIAREPLSSGLFA